MKKHLKADKEILLSCSEVEKPHLRYCIQRTNQFLELGQDQPVFNYDDHPVPQFDFEGV
jgi:hypothetical protein